MQFPFGKAPFLILLVALITGAGVLWSHSRYREERADLVVVTHARLHADIYRAKLPEFEKKHGVRVAVQEVEEVALRTRLLAAFAAGSEVPDVVEIPQNPAAFLNGPVRDIGFLDLTAWVKEQHLDEQLVASRFSIWQRKGVIFGLPHDVHPVMLAYRADIVEDQLGIDPTTIETWDDFIALQPKLVRDQNGDGKPDQFALEMPVEGGDMLNILLLQRDAGLFDAEGGVIFDSGISVQTFLWYVRQLHGPKAIGYAPGYGQSMWQALNDGLILFWFTPDWRTRQFEEWVPALKGKMKLMPLPAWRKGERRTSTWGATGIAVTKKSKHPELARELLKFLYVDQSDAGKSWADMRIIPPARSAWNQPVFDQPSEYYRGQPVMKLYAQLAPDVPPSYTSPFTLKAIAKRNEAFLNTAAYYRQKGEQGLEEFARRELKRQADTLRAVIARSRITDE